MNFGGHVQSAVMASFLSAFLLWHSLTEALPAGSKDVSGVIRASLTFWNHREAM